MIRFVSSSDQRFKPLAFGPGLNVLLADRTTKSSDRDSRNGSGKSSLVQVLHFLLGGNANKQSLFRKPELEHQAFALGLDLGDVHSIIVRSGHDPNTHLYSESTSASTLGVFPELDSDGRAPEGWEKLSLTQWRRRLGQAFLDLKPDPPKYSPSARSLLSYLMRREGSGGFSDPFRHSYMQQSWDAQVGLSAMLGLDWSIPAEFERVREDQKKIDNLRKAARNGTLGIEIGTVAELRTEIAVTREHADRLQEQARAFTIVEQYAPFEREADQLTRRLRQLRDDNAIDRELIDDLAEAADSEAPPGAAELDRLWDQANVVLPDLVRSTYDDLKAFHESVIENRQLYLAGEAELARGRIELRHAERETIDRRRSELMQLLSSGGALEQFTALESEVARAEGDLRELQKRYELAETFESGKAKADQRRQELLLLLQGDHHDRADRLSRAIVLFEQFSQTLYGERRGSLVVSETLHGPEFDVEIAGKGSVGIDSMQILCVDFMLATLLQERGVGPGFLVHDSHIFDGVDERQVASALMLGAELANTYGFQYIVTMNSDGVPTFPKSFDFESYVNSVRLTDAGDDGGLFGFKFD